MNTLDWLRFPSLSALRALEATVRTGSFSGAARVLNVTHAAVAQQVRNLEEQLGYALVVRDGRLLSFTDQGRTLAEAANEGFGTIQVALTEIDKSRNTKTLAVTMSPIFAEKWLVPRLGRFLRAHPGLRSVCFNGAKAQAIFRRQVLPMLAATPTFNMIQLPSTSPAHAARTSGQKLAAWRVLTRPARLPTGTRKACGASARKPSTCTNMVLTR